MIGNKTHFVPSFKGKHHTEETKERMRIKKIGKNNPMKKKENQEKVRRTIQGLYDEGKLVAGMTGRKHSNEAKQKLSIIHTGKPKLYLKGVPKSQEHKKKLSDVRKRLFTEGKINWNISKYNKNHKKDKHPRWLGEKSFEVYPPTFNKEFKNLIKLRDNFCCLNCNISEQKHIIINRKKLTIHHIDYNKKNTCFINCCTVCNRCNLKANINRKEWVNYYQLLLSKKYNYTYDYTEDNSNKNIQMGEIINDRIAANYC